MSQQNQRLVFTSYPEGLIQESNFKLETIEQPPKPSKPSEVVIRLLCLSVDPYMRMRMNKSVPKGYFDPFQLGEPLHGGVVARVEQVFEETNFQIGDVVLGGLPWILEQLVDTSKTPLRRLDRDTLHDIPKSYFLGALGMPGLTAYFGLLDICQPKPNETVVVSAASGAVGSVVGQIAKRVLGCKRVIGISGQTSPQVVQQLLENGFDQILNYKDYNNSVSELKQALEQACPEGIDCYFENVGGFILDAVSLCMNKFGRIAFCGAISSYNNNLPSEEQGATGTCTTFEQQDANLQEKYGLGLRLTSIHVVRELKTQGFLVNSYSKQFGEATQQLVQWTRSGQLKVFETKEKGMHRIPHAMQRLFTGEKTGKVIVDLEN
ncbi:hypothetical protein C9374_001238 [Naegleria lovaniensis]|uniref:Enoyl reductase (ER) domain-containing protein n=1 Tax=Naegleria lovaniensis TaxID=51637 RepID=A0AA88GX01_NAELO|nr:uncharacterized protein C9374_001238 [Naegleria lovaniensis]KAG2387644.1 hypothetical protein C9374_001238 [Naegleria lovaniensis]